MAISQHADQKDDPQDSIRQWLETWVTENGYSLPLLVSVLICCFNEDTIPMYLLDPNTQQPSEDLYVKLAETTLPFLLNYYFQNNIAPDKNFLGHSDAKLSPVLTDVILSRLLNFGDDTLVNVYLNMSTLDIDPKELFFLARIAPDRDQLTTLKLILMKCNELQLLNSTNEYGMTVLHIAAMRCNADFIHIMSQIDHATIDTLIRDTYLGFTALDMAICAKQLPSQLQGYKYQSRDGQVLPLFDLHRHEKLSPLGPLYRSIRFTDFAKVDPEYDLLHEQCILFLKKMLSEKKDDAEYTKSVCMTRLMKDLIRINNDEEVRQLDIVTFRTKALNRYDLYEEGLHVLQDFQSPVNTVRALSVYSHVFELPLLLTLCDQYGLECHYIGLATSPTVLTNRDIFQNWRFSRVHFCTELTDGNFNLLILDTLDSRVPASELKELLQRISEPELVVLISHLDEHEWCYYINIFRAFTRMNAITIEYLHSWRQRVFETMCRSGSPKILSENRLYMSLLHIKK